MLLDDIMAQLSDVGLRVWRMDQHETRGWCIILEDYNADPLQWFEGDGATAAEAMTECFRKAGVNIEDDGT